MVYNFAVYAARRELWLKWSIVSQPLQEQAFKHPFRMSAPKQVVLLPRQVPEVRNVEIKYERRRSDVSMTVYWRSPGLDYYTVVEQYNDRTKPMRRIVGNSTRATGKVLLHSRDYPALLACGEADLIMYHQSVRSNEFGPYRLVRLRPPSWTTLRKKKFKK